MTRQHLRALFSDSSASVGSKHHCLAARSPWQTRSKILSNHHLSAARSLWQTQSKTLSKHRPCAAKSSWQSHRSSRLFQALSLTKHLQPDRFFTNTQRRDRHSLRKAAVAGRHLLQKSSQTMRLKCSSKLPIGIWTSLKKPHPANESLCQSHQFSKKARGRVSGSRGRTKHRQEWCGVLLIPF